MPICYEIIPALSLIVSIHSGVVEDGEFVAYYGKLFADRTYHPHCSYCIDLSQSDSSVRTPEGLKSLVHTMQISDHGSVRGMRIALVAPSDISYGMSRMFMAIAAGLSYEIGLFSEFASAAEWLGVDEEISLESFCEEVLHKTLF